VKGLETHYFSSITFYVACTSSSKDIASYIVLCRFSIQWKWYM